MATILIAGDSWGIGVFTGQDESYGPTGQGIHSILESQGHTVTNISQGGGSNWLMIDRLNGHWGNTGRCMFGAPADPVLFDLTQIDYIVFLQTDIFRERHYYGKQCPTDTVNMWKILEQAFIDRLLDYESMDSIIDGYFAEFYSKLNEIGVKFNKKILMIGGWSQLHPSIDNYSNLVGVIPSATRLLIPELAQDVYLSDPEWYMQLAADKKFMSKFSNEFKLMSIVAADKLDLIYKNWREVHPDLNGYQKLTDVLIEEIK